MTTKIPAELSSTPGISDSSNATAITINSSEQVGIGTTSPDFLLDVEGSNTQMKVGAASQDGGFLTSTDNNQLIVSGGFYYNGSNFIAASTSASGVSFDNGATFFYNNTSLTDGNSFTLTEKMRLESTGKLTLAADAGYIGDDSSGILQLRTHSTAGGWGISARNYTNTTTGYWYIGKMTNGTNIFSMTSDSDSIDLNFLSDERMKMNITDSADVLDKVKQITVKDFDWRTELNGDTKDDSRPSKEYGFIAQNFQDIGLGQYVKELMPTDESDDTLGMDYGNITPILVKAIQEQQTIIDDLKARIETLEGG